MPLVVTGFVTAGNFKAAPLFAAIPVDLTAALAVLTLLIVIWIPVRRGSVPRAVLVAASGPVVLLTSALWAPHTSYAGQKALYLATLTLLSAVAPAALIRSTADVRRFVNAWLIVCTLIVLLSLIYPVPEGTYAGSPIEGTATTIGLGRAAGVMLIVAALALWHREMRPLLTVPLITAAAVAMFAAGSRGPLAAAVGAVVLVAVLAKAHAAIIRGVGVLGVVAGCMFVAFGMAPVYSQARIIGLAGGRLDNSTTTRLELFRVAWRSFVARPFGLGLGGFAEIAPSGYTYPHDVVLEVLVEAGVVVGVAFLCWVGWSWWRSRLSVSDYASSAVFAISTFMIINALVSGDVNSNRTMFLALGLGIATSGVYLRGSVSRSVQERGGPPFQLARSGR